MLFRIPPHSSSRRDAARPPQGASPPVKPGEEITRASLVATLVQVVRSGGYGPQSFDSHGRNNLLNDGWIEMTDQAGVYRRLQRPGEEAPASGPVETAEKGIDDAPPTVVEGSASDSVNTDLPTRIGNFRLADGT